MPLAETEFTVRLPVPVFWIVTLCDPLLPVVTLPNARLAGDTEIAGAAAAAPVPVMLTILLEVDALLEIETLPDDALVVVGANFTLKLAEAPAAIVAGVPIPATEYPVPLATRELSVKLALPVFCTDTVCVADWPTVTLPKERADGETAIAGAGADCPVPVSAAVEGEVGASLLIEIVPELLPTVVGK